MTNTIDYTSGFNWTSDTLDHATNDEVAFQFDYTTNKAAGNDTGLLINQTDTASPGTSLLAHFQVGVTSMFKVANDGNVTYGNPAAASSCKLINASDSNVYIRSVAGFGHGYHAISNAAGKEVVMIGTYNALTAIRMDPSTVIAWGTTDVLSSLDLYLYRDAAATLAQRNSTNAQTFRVYTTYTDSSNRENLAITGNAITVETAGTGTDNIDLTLTPAGTGDVAIAAGFKLAVDRTTDDAAFINFKATADADATSAISTLTTSGSTTHHIQVEINGTTAWIACSTTDPT